MMQINKNAMFVVLAILVVMITIVLIVANATSLNALSFLKIGNPSKEAVAKNAVDYINSNSLAGPGVTVKLINVSEEEGLVKFRIEVGGQEVDSYVTKNGKLLFPTGIALTPPTAAVNTNTPDPNAGANLVKVEKPALEAFVVSACPYGLQMQRAIVEAVKTVPALAESIKIRYIGGVSGNSITAMHDAGPNGLEAQENMRQMCIREEQPEKFYDYLACYMQKSAGALPNGMPLGDHTACLASTGVDVAKVNSCVSSPARGLAYAKADFAIADAYNSNSESCKANPGNCPVAGSPSLILDGNRISESPFGGRSAYAMMNIICSDSINAPEYCSTNLTTDQAAVSFSLAYAGAGGTGSMANCAPAQ